jgi:hypothetical protein
MKSAKALHEQKVVALRDEAHRLLGELQMTGEREGGGFWYPAQLSWYNGLSSWDSRRMSHDCGTR